MASQLPPELLIIITSDLHFTDKLACSNVCRQWHKSIKCTTLLSHLLFESYFNWLLFDQLLKERKLNGSLVKRLEIGSECFRVQNFFKLPKYFPRLEELFYKAKQIGQQKDDYINELNDFKVWETSLAKLELHSMASVLPILFQNLYFSKLTSIRLKWPVKANENPIPDTFFDTLVNLPSLDSLHLCFSNFSLGSLELLHQSTPQLTKLTIEANILTERSIEFPNRSDVPQSLPKLKSFRLVGDYSNFRMATAMLIYFMLKYGSLEHFSMIKKDMKIGRFITDINLEDMQRFDRARETLINTLPLKTFGMNHHAINDRLWRLICQKNIQVTDLGASYLSLNSLTTIFHSEKDIKNLKTLIISHFDGDVLLDFPFIPHLKRLGVRKCHRSNEVPMDTILERSPALHYLYLYDCVAQVRFPARLSHFNSSLKTLSLDHISVESSNLFDYISKYCPLLENLHLDSVKFISSGLHGAQVSLPQHRLKELFILMPYGINGCTIKTQAKRHRFCAEFSDNLDFYLFQRSSIGREAFHIIDLDNSDILPSRFDNMAMYMVLECRSAQQFRLNYEWISLENPKNLRSSNL